METGRTSTSRRRSARGVRKAYSTRNVHLGTLVSVGGTLTSIPPSSMSNPCDCEWAGLDAYQGSYSLG